MENIELIYTEYKRLVERYDQLLDSSFADIKLYGILGPLLLGSTTFLKSLNSLAFKESFSLFTILLLLIFIIAVVAFRDLLKQSYLQQLGYNIGKYEIYLHKKILDESEQSEFLIFTLRKSWLEKYYKITKVAYVGFIFIFVITITAIPILILWNTPLLAILITIITSILLSIYSILSSIIFNKTNKYEE